MAGLVVELEGLDESARRSDLVEGAVERPLAGPAGDDVAPAAAGAGVEVAHVEVVPRGPVHWATRSASMCASKTRDADASNSREKAMVCVAGQGGDGA